MAHTKYEVLFKKESAWGTGVDGTGTLSSEYLGLTQNASYSIENSNNTGTPAHGGVPTHIGQGPATVSGRVDFQYNTGLPFAIMLGAVTATTPVEESAPYKWTITPTADAIPFTANYFADGTNDLIVQLLGCYAKSLSFDLSVTSPAKGTFEFIGKDYDKDAPFTAITTFSPDAAASIIAQDLTIDVGALKSISYITDISFKCQRNVKMGHGIGSNVPNVVNVGKFEPITGTIIAWVEDSATAAELEELVTGGSALGAIVAQDIVITRGTAEAADNIIITIDDAMFDSVELSFPLDGGFAYKIPFTAKSISSVVWEAPITVAAGLW